MPDNGAILVFTDAASKQLELESYIKEKSDQKNIKIMFALFNYTGHAYAYDSYSYYASPTNPYPIQSSSMEVYKRLSNDRIFWVPADGSLNLDSKDFLDAVVHTVRNYIF